MAMVCGDSSQESYVSIQMPGLTSSSSSPMSEGSKDNILAGMDIHEFKGVQDMHEIVEELCHSLVARSSEQQYVAFGSVTPAQLEEIDKAHHILGKHLRLSYYEDWSLVIVKVMPSILLEVAHQSLSTLFREKLTKMGLNRTIRSTGSARRPGKRSSKEPDASYFPYPERRSYDWPTIVCEAGLSESLARLQQDAYWWLMESAGEVKIVILISLGSELSAVRIQKWELLSGPRRYSSRATNTNPPVPTNIHEVVIEPHTMVVTGAPLKLEFSKIFLREPPTATEGDVIFQKEDLLQFAADLLC